MIIIDLVKALFICVFGWVFIVAWCFIEALLIPVKLIANILKS